eukprot:TRINITY_DN6336_c0_g2_i1.p1 TRINITY_DN6336_c0_g2~~TRINITY_DN6336_c0_g2_i1.p1  ORF type:complete len:101 (+),score=12.10 TRINITY_DN6336_c0_g2_i1:50-352(+)
MATINPEGTRWSAAGLDDSGVVDAFHPVPWEFHDGGIISAGSLWKGKYSPTPGAPGRFDVSLRVGIEAVDVFQVIFVTTKTFIAVKDNAVYRFGSRIIKS